MARYRKKPVEIEAFKFVPVRTEHGWKAENPPLWFSHAESQAIVRVDFDSQGIYCLIHSLEGSMRASEGDFIIQGVKRELYPCKPDIFEATYELVEGEKADG